MSRVNTIIVPIINPHNIERMLFTLYRYTERDSFYVIVIDQTTTKEAQEKCEKYSHLWIKTYRNLGFSKAMNTGIVLSQTPYITLANDDVEYMDSRWWQGVVDTFKMDERIVAVNPMSPKEGSFGYGLTNENRDIWMPPCEYVCENTNKEYVYPKKDDGTGIFYKDEFSSDDYDFLLNEHKRYKRGTVVDGLCMWHTTFKREGIEELGLLDEKFYPGGGEDYEMNCRAYSCAWPYPREVCDPQYHKRMVSTSLSWVWHHWSSSRNIDSNNPIFSRPRWNDLGEIWGDHFDTWGHENLPDGTRKPLVRRKKVYSEEL